MQQHYVPLKKVIESIHYGEMISYNVGEITDVDRKEILKFVKKIAKKNLIDLHIRWTKDGKSIKIIETF